MRGVLSKRVRVLPRAHPAPFSARTPALPAPHPPNRSDAPAPGLVLAANDWTKKWAMMA